MRGHAGGVAGDDLPAWWAGDGVDVAEGIASLGAVGHLVRAIRAARSARMVRDRCAADEDRRLVQGVLGTVASTPVDRLTMPAEAGRGSRR